MKPLIVHPSAYTRLKKKRKISDTGTHYSVVLTPVCYHRQPKNENELRVAITAVLKGLNQLHSRGMPD